MLSNILLLILLSSIIGVAFNLMLDDKMIFEWYKDWLKTINPYIAKPLGLCVTCNSTWIGFIIGFLYLHNFECILVGIGTTFIATFFSALLNLINRIE